MGTDEEAERGKYGSPEGRKTWEYLATIACSFLMFCIGSAQGWNSPSSVKLTENDSPVHLTPSELSNLMSLLAIGQLLAPPLNSMIVDRIGRKNTIIVVGMPLILSWALISLAGNVVVLYVARLAAGLSQGVGYCVCYMYVGEISSTRTRGLANSLVLIMFNLGMLMAFALVPCLSVSINAWLNLVLVLLFVLCFRFMPESPYYLAMIERYDDAEEVLIKLRGKIDVSDELEMIERSLRNSRKINEVRNSGNKNNNNPGLGALFADKASSRAVLVIGLFSATHHFGGNVPVLTYGQKIFRDLDVQLVSDHAASVINGAVQLLSICLIAPLVDDWGRKPLVRLSGCFAGICNLVVGVYFYLQEHTDRYDQRLADYSWLPMIALFLVVFSFNCGLQIVQGILISELFAPEHKALGVCVVIMNGGWMYALSTKLYLMVSDEWGYGNAVPFFAFACVVWIITGVLLRIMPETKGKTLLEIQKALLE